MKTVAALVSALVLALGCGLVLGTAPTAIAPAYAAGTHPLPEATKKKPAKPKATPTPTPVTATPSPAPTRTAADIEGERWVQLAVIAGGGLLAAVAVFFVIGALLRRRPRR